MRVDISAFLFISIIPILFIIVFIKHEGQGWNSTWILKNQALLKGMEVGERKLLKVVF